MTGSFVRRKIAVSFTYGSGAGGGTTGSTVRHEGLRCTASVNVSGAPSFAELNLRMYGLPLADMNALSTLGIPVAAVRNNQVTVEAGDDAAGMAQVFSGTIFSAWTDFQGAPDVAFEVTAHGGILPKMQPGAPTSFKGSQDAASIISQLAGKMGYAFENNGVSANLSNPYFAGTLMDQALAAVRAANAEMVVDGNILAIWPRGGNRKASTVTLSAATGMIGYPNYTANGISVRSIFNPNFRFGALVRVESSAIATSAGQASTQQQASVLPVDGNWKVVTLAHDLSCELPGGPWETQMVMTLPGLLVVPSGVR